MLFGAGAYPQIATSSMPVRNDSQRIFPSDLFLAVTLPTPSNITAIAIGHSNTNANIKRSKIMVASTCEEKASRKLLKIQYAASVICQFTLR